MGVKKGYLGIDESNHGRYPEIYVAVYSMNKKLLEDEGGLPKLRRNRNGIEKVLERNKFKWIRFGEEYKKREVHPNVIKIIAISEFMKAYTNLKTIYVDGDLQEGIIDKVNLFTPNINVEIKNYIQGDNRFRIINYADRIAHHIFRLHSPRKRENEEKIKKLEKRMITPDLLSYLNYLAI